MRLYLRAAAIAVVGVVLSCGVARAQSASIGYNFEASNGTESTSIPPDTNGAVGPNHIVMQANGRSKMFDKSGTFAAGTTQTLTNFWSARVGITPTGSAFDPRIVYDRASGRWFASANDAAATVNSGTLIGVSPGSNPTAASWFGVRQDMDSSADPRWADYNQLAVGPTWVAVTNNMFDVSGVGTNLSVLVSLITIPKAEFVGGSVANLNYKPNLNPNLYGFTPHTVTDFYGSSPSTQYTLSRYNTTVLQLSTISGSTGNPTYTDFALLITVPAQYDHSFPATAGAPQLGSGTLVDSGDSRISAQPVLVNGKLWAVHAVSATNGGTQSVIRWYRINPTTNQLEASGTLPGTGAMHVYYPSIAVNQAGDIVIGYSGSNSSTFPSAYYTVGTFNGSTTTFSNPVLAHAGTGAITNGRFGDYSSANIDPADPGVFWSFQEYGSAGSEWRTRSTEVIPTRAGEVRWKTAAAAALLTGTAWYNDTAPTSTDHVIFSRWSTSSYAVDATGGATYDRLSVRQTGSGTVTLNIPTGATLSLTNTSASTPSLAVSEFQGQSNVTVSGGGTLSTRHAVIAGEQTGTGTVTITGTGTTWTNANDLNLGGTATAAGGSGVLSVQAGAAVNVGGTLRVYRNDATAIQVNVGTGSVVSTAGLTAAAGTPRIDLATATSQLVVTDGLGTTFAGTVSGSGSVTKQGTGNFTLTGNNTYAGGTTVSGGSLLVNGQSGTNSGTGTGAVSMTGGSLRGTGRIGGSVSATGGTLAPGTASGPGVLTIGSGVTLTSSASFTARLNGAAAGTGHDQLRVESGTVALGSATLNLSLGYTPGASDVLVIVNNTGTGTTTGEFAGFGFGTGVDVGGTLVYVVYDYNLGVGFGGGNDVAVVFTNPVPEPGAVLALAAVGLGALRSRRKRTSAAGC